jgi:hypothetical protein
MKINFRLFFSLFICCTGIFACVDTFDVTLKAAKSYLVVDGTITDLDEPQIITISKTQEAATYESSQFTSTISGNKTNSTPITKAIVKVLVNNTQMISLTETEAGNYQFPKTFKGKVDDSYQLLFQTSEGKNYESNAETMMHVPEIKSITENFNTKGIKKYAFSEEYVPTNDISIDFDDTGNEKNFYRWKWTNWEILKICETCLRGKYYLYENESGVTGDCFKDLTLEYNNIYDYTCGDNAWDIFYSDDIKIFADTYTDGQPQKNKLIAQIPLRQSNPTLIAIRQASMTASAYRYAKLIQDEIVNTGTLADTPPAPIKSNVTNTENKEELVLGFFSASSISEVRYMMSRKNTKGGSFNGLFKYLNNRLPNLEEKSQERPYIPLAIAKKSKSLTPETPKGWKFTL